MRVYLLVVLVAASVTYLTTPLARWLALRTGAITAVRSRDVHSVPTPRLGGVAMLLGIAAAMVVASRMPFLEGVFSQREAWAILGGAAMVCLLGVADDIWDLDWFTKLIGQVLAAGVMAWQGGVWLYAVPIAGQTIGSSQLSLVVTVLVIVVAMNAVNFVDGLDGLAAGVVAIGGTGFFVYTYLLSRDVSAENYANVASLVVAVLVGACLGFLPHNFHPARIFMGDSGSMLIGLVIAAAGIVVTGQIDTVVVEERQQIPAFLPIVLPVAVLLLPLLDMGLAVVRRVGAGRSPFHPDRLHLHHRLLELGHSHRRAVLIMYLWTALFAFGAAGLAVWTTGTTLGVLGAGAVVVLLLTLGPMRGAALRPRPTTRSATR
ncbi:MraY family glycosyltransferase [Cellulomonas bogoriensis]|uniref:UDP-N-acetylmuramyl pentapeptide phosphotransferase n=1 Tax=Cellulomonas bogoriensis 69B4 = DSM 16987 TaxID=1386082 RepID=A0A0A0BZH8_9CELL|nr:MraY family glycosyltransferase [Cellulomonas bogoriensis]KGM13778.1 UDP-N-acetylmuramyl pentapeptide phosphotransferase [Cellulomonas bogoriensis 69B4 = DSM 16987]